MSTRRKILDSLISSSMTRDVATVPRPVVVEERTALFRQGSASVYATPVLHTNEIELSLELPDREKCFRQDAIQAWLGQPIRAYLFNDGTIERAARDVVDTIESLFRKLGGETEPQFAALEAAGDKLSDESLRNWMREEADHAWKTGRYEDAAELYKKLSPTLSKLEAKRLDMSKRLPNKKPAE